MSSETAPRYRYNAALAADIEQRWQRYWAEHGTFHTPNPTGELASTGAVPEQKSYLLDMFPYPSGTGLHVGHPLGYIATDVLGRFQRMAGMNVLHALGFDAFGLPAEQYAVQTGQHPRTTTETNMARFREQLSQLGLAHDPRRSVVTTDPEFYRWTQWIFLRIYHSFYDEQEGKARPIAALEAEFAAGMRETSDGSAWSELDDQRRRRELDRHRLVYLTESPVNWCPGLGTVLSNEEVTPEGRSERGNFPVFRRNLRQWMMRISAYADRLVDDLDRVEWPDSVKAMQRNWIGRSDGAELTFRSVAGQDITVFTTRPDTVFGASYLVLAPEHPAVDPLTTPDRAQQLADYRRQAQRRSELDRQEAKSKTGEFTGSYAINPVTGNKIPVYVADYVLYGYGTGAIMAVPGEDQRDWEFAQTYDLPIVRTVQPPEDFDGEAYTGDGPSINSSNADIDLNGLEIAEAKQAILVWLKSSGAGRRVRQYKLRDWLFSRQRYWGEPFPIVYDEQGNPHALPEDQLPVQLPDVADYSPRTYDAEDADSVPSPPLERAEPEWLTVELDLGAGKQRYTREVNTMPNWAGSCWYYLRYLDPNNSRTFCDPELERYWLGSTHGRHGSKDPGGVDLYVGGVEHAVLHLLYARFWHKVLYDLGEVSSEEPFRRLLNQGYIQAYAYTDSRGSYVPAEEVTEGDDGAWYYMGEPVRQEYGKMGKSLKNVVTPDDMCEEFGADTFRLYEMSMAPIEASRPWSTRDVIGSHRFLQRIWRAIVDEETGQTVLSEDEPEAETLRLLHRVIAFVSEEFAQMRFNTGVARLIELTNHLTKRAADGMATPRAVAEPLTLMLAPVCPHLAEELWSRLGHEGSLAYESFPEADPTLAAAEEVEYPIQFNGKVRSRTVQAAAAGEDQLRAAALSDERIREALQGSEPKKVIVVPGRLINVVG